MFRFSHSSFFLVKLYKVPGLYINFNKMSSYSNLKLVSPLFLILALSIQFAAVVGTQYGSTTAAAVVGTENSPLMEGNAQYMKWNADPPALLGANVCVQMRL
jgi:hypothetical protein